MGLLPVQECCCPAVKEDKKEDKKERHTNRCDSLPWGAKCGGALLSLELVINAPRTYSTTLRPASLCPPPPSFL